MGAPAAQAARKAVDSMSSLGMLNSVTLQRALGGDGVMRAPSADQRGSAATDTIDGKVARAVPRVEVGHRVGTENQHEPRCVGRLIVDKHLLQSFDGVDGVARARTPDLDFGDHHALDVGTREPHHLQPMVRVGHDTVALLPRVTGRDHQHMLEPELVARRNCGREVRVVGRVERATEDPDARHRTAPPFTSVIALRRGAALRPGTRRTLLLLHHTTTRLGLGIESVEFPLQVSVIAHPVGVEATGGNGLDHRATRLTVVRAVGEAA